MCGIVGIAGALEYKDELAMKRLLFLDYFRGTDSVGFAAVRNNGDVKIAKTTGSPVDLLDMAKFKDALNGLNSKVFLGHNRAATRGVVSHYNAHPFQVDHIIGAHNGTLDHDSVKALEEAAGDKFPVDSQALIAAIAKVGIKAAIEMCREGKDSSAGAWSIVWYDEFEGSLNFIRNKHRPMWYGYTSDFKKVMFASEWPMIEAVQNLALPRYSPYAEKETGYKFFETKENVHYKFDVEVLKAGGEKKPKPTVKEIKGKEPKPVAASSGSNPDPFGRDQASATIIGFHQPTGSGSPSKTSTTRSPSKGPKIVHLLGDLHNPFGGFIDRSTFDEMAKYGCSWCSGNVDWGDKGVLIFERDGIILCSGCVHGDEDPAGSSGATRIYTKQNINAL